MEDGEVLLCPHALTSATAEKMISFFNWSPFALINPHSPGKYRVNGLMVNMPRFQQAFSCKPGQAMVSEKRCRVW